MTNTLTLRCYHDNGEHFDSCPEWAVVTITPELIAQVHLLRQEILARRTIQSIVEYTTCVTFHEYDEDEEGMERLGEVVQTAALLHVDKGGSWFSGRREVSGRRFRTMGVEQGQFQASWEDARSAATISESLADAAREDLRETQRASAKAKEEMDAAQKANKAAAREEAEANKAAREAEAAWEKAQDAWEKAQAAWEKAQAAEAAWEKAQAAEEEAAKVVKERDADAVAATEHRNTTYTLL